ncbi:MAG: M14 family metallocarboxypeptidase [Nanoarchaeota archaeon]
MVDEKTAEEDGSFNPLGPYSQDIMPLLERNPNSALIGSVGRLNDYPLFMVRAGYGPKVLLTAGIHGAEPAGVYALTQFIRERMDQYAESLDLTILPCVNPWGFDRNLEEINGHGININREFRHDTHSYENKIIMSLLGHYVLTMDLHETGRTTEGVAKGEPVHSPEDFFLWEICPDKDLRFGQEIASAVRALGMPMHDGPNVYEDVSVGGVITYPEGCGTADYAAGTAFDTYLAAHRTPQAFTIETPARLPLELRVKAGLTSIEIALEHARHR